jgi:DNA ligase-1
VSTLIQAYYTLGNVALTNSITEKVALIEQYKDNPYLRQMLELSVGPQTYNAYPDWSTVLAMHAEREPWPSSEEEAVSTYEYFIRLLNRLQRHELTGNAAVDVLNQFFMDTGLSQAEVGYLGGIINHDLRVGVRRGTIERVWPQEHDPGAPITPDNWPNVQLAKKLDKPTRIPWDKGPFILEPKLDGLRMMFCWSEPTEGSLFGPGARVMGFTRNGHHYDPVKFIEQELTQVAPDLAVDCEAMALAGGWNITSSLVKRKYVDKSMWKKMAKDEARAPLLDLSITDPEEQAEYLWRLISENVYGFCWSAMPVEHFRAGHSPLTEDERYLLAQERLSGLERVIVLPRALAHNESELAAYNERILDEGITIEHNGRTLKLTAEGTMIKFPWGTYTCHHSRRSKYWWKLKPWDDVTVKVVGFVEGTGKYVGMLGAFVVQMPTGEQVQAAGELTDRVRAEVWQDKDAWMGKLLDVKIQGDKVPVASARFPQVQKWPDTGDLKVRDDVSWEQVVAAYEN